MTTINELDFLFIGVDVVFNIIICDRQKHKEEQQNVVLILTYARASSKRLFNLYFVRLPSSSSRIADLNFQNGNFNNGRDVVNPKRAHTYTYVLSYSHTRKEISKFVLLIAFTFFCFCLMF